MSITHRGIRNTSPKNGNRYTLTAHPAFDISPSDWQESPVQLGTVVVVMDEGRIAASDVDIPELAGYRFRPVRRCMTVEEVAESVRRTNPRITTLTWHNPRQGQGHFEPFACIRQEGRTH